MSDEFPFAGRHPKDWNSDEAHPYVVKFVDEPSVETKTALAELVERVLATGPAAADDQPWLWSGSFAKLHLRERWANARALFAAAAEFFQALHKLAPIQQVLFLGWVEERDASRETWAARLVPDPFGSILHPKNNELPKPGIDEAFEQARKNARASRPVTADGVTLHPSDHDADVLLGLAHPPGLEKVLNLEGQTPPRIPNDGDEVHCTEPLPLAIERSDGRAQRVVYVRDGERRVIEGLPTPFSWPVACPDGERGYARVGDTIYELSFKDGTAVKRYESDVPLERMVAVGEHLVATTPTNIVVLAMGEEPGVVASVRRPQCTGLASSDNAVVWLECRKKTLAFGFRDGKLKKLATIKAELRVAPRRVDGKLLAHDRQRGTLEIRGLDEAFDAWAPPRKAKPKSARSSR